MALASEALGNFAESDPTEEEILRVVATVRAGDTAQFDLLVEWHRDMVHRMAWRLMQDSEAALDVTQEVFLRLYRGLRTWKANSKFSTWLYRIVNNTAIDIMRQEARHRRHQTPLLEEHLATIPAPSGGSSNPRSVAVRNQLRAKVFEAVTSLSPKQRACFTMRHYQHMALAEIADALGCSEGAVKKHLARAVERLRRQLGVQ